MQTSFLHSITVAQIRALSFSEFGRLHIVGFERAKILPKKEKGLMKKKLSLSAKLDSRAMEIRIDFLSTKELRRALADMAFDLRTIC